MTPDGDTKQEFLLTIGPGGPAMHRLVEEELLDLGCVPERFGQARFYFSTDVEPVERFFRLRSPEKLYALVLRLKADELPWPAEQEASEAFLAQRVAASSGWSRALETCRTFGRQMPSTFRVSAKRAGRRAAHLSSNGIAEFVGEALAEAMDWQVDLHDYDLEVVVHLNDDHLIVGLPLLERSGQQAQFALPGLSQPVAWAMARRSPWRWLVFSGKRVVLYCSRLMVFSAKRVAVLLTLHDGMFTNGMFADAFSSLSGLQRVFSGKPVAVLLTLHGGMSTNGMFADASSWLSGLQREAWSCTAHASWWPVLTACLQMHFPGCQDFSGKRVAILLTLRGGMFTNGMFADAFSWLS
eukprot:s515_g25.t1